MKKFLPFVFPLAALIIIVLLVIRWYSLNTSPRSDSQIGEGVEIEDLSTAERDAVVRGVGDFKSVTMTSEKPAEGQPSITSTGQVRYEVEGDRVRFSVTANLPASTSTYQVWLKKEGAENFSKAFVLTEGKGGYMGTAAFSVDELPVEVVVSQEVNNDVQMERVLLRGSIPS